MPLTFFAAWHGYAIASVVFAGLFSFLLKVGAERAHGSAALNTVVSLTSLACSLVGMLWVHEPLTWSLFLLAFVNGFMYIFGSVARSDALANIHATLFFPLYKVTGPILVLILGIVFLGERLTAVQSIGFLLAVTVPLLLIDRFEHTRQKDLAKGIRYMLISTAMIGGGTILSKIAMSEGGDVFTFSAIACFVTIVGTSVMHLNGTGKGIGEAPWRGVFLIGITAGICQFLGFILLLFAYQAGPMSIAYAINSTYILIPIVLSIWFYGEHWRAEARGDSALVSRRGPPALVNNVKVSP